MKGAGCIGHGAEVPIRKLICWTGLASVRMMPLSTLGLLNSRLESNKEEERSIPSVGVTGAGCVGHVTGAGCVGNSFSGTGAAPTHLCHVR